MSLNFCVHPVLLFIVYAVSCVLIVSIAELDDDIAYLQSRLLEFPRSRNEHKISVQNLADMRSLRYEKSGQKEDLDESILCFTKAILLSPLSPTHPHFPNVAQLLFGLTWPLFGRSRDFDRPEDAKACISFLRHLRTLPLESFGPQREDVTAWLIVTLSTPVESDWGRVTGNIEEIMGLFRELVTSSVPTIAVVESISRVLHDGGLSIPSLNKVVECLEDVARGVCQLEPDSQTIVLYLLASALCSRFKQSHSKDDHKNAMALLDSIIDPNLHENCPDWIRDRASDIAVSLSVNILKTFQNPEYLEAAIPRLRAYVNSSSAGEGERLASIYALTQFAMTRFESYSLADSREEADFYTGQLIGRDGPGESDPVQDTNSIQQMIQRLEERLSETPPGPTNSDILGELLSLYYIKISLTNDLLDIEQSIKYGRLLLNTSENEKALDFLSGDLFRAFQHTNNIKYLDEEITLFYDLLKLDRNQGTHFYIVKMLVLSLMGRWSLLQRSEDLAEILRLIQLAANDQNAIESDRFDLSCQWAYWARATGHSSALAAYENAMSLMQKSLSFSPTVSLQHTRLLEISTYCQAMPLNYASFLIGLSRFEEAVEILEQGRAQLWSEMRGLRTPMSQLVAEDLALANQFAKINEELEAQAPGSPKDVTETAARECRLFIGTLVDAYRSPR